MMFSKFLPLGKAALAFAGLCVASIGIVDADVIPAAQSSGDYSPSAGGAAAHWTITKTHALLWGGSAYVPAGGVFQPRSLADAAEGTDANWAADARDLRLLKQKGVTQLLIKPGAANAQLTITEIPTAALQRVVTYLDQNGFTYGLDVCAFPAATTQAVTVNPALYRLPDPPAGTYASVGNIAGLAGGSYFLVSTHDKSVLKHGAILMQNSSDAVTGQPVGGVAPTGSSGGPETVLLTYPTRDFGPDTIEERGCPDFWRESDKVRDDLLIYLGKIRFGAGLRFFVDPIRDDLGYYGASGVGRGFIPTSEAYRRQFQNWLSAKYSGRLTALEQAWRLKNEDLPDIATAARVIPLWNQGKGLEQLYDVSEDKLYDAQASRSAVWSDIRGFQNDSMQAAMNGIANALKNGVADVPVLYRWTQSSTVTLNTSASGFDGLLIDSPLHGDDLGAQANGYALSDAEHARRTQWLMNELALPNPTDAAARAAKLSGFGTQERLSGDSRVLLSLGSRGFYVDALRRAASDSRSLLNAPPEQLGWLASQSSVYATDANGLADQSPSILYYPSNLHLAGTRTTQFSQDLWWLPASFDSTPLALGQNVQGYTLPGTDANPAASFVLYTPSNEPQTLLLPFSSKLHPLVTNAAGALVPTASKKGIMTLVVGQDPVIISDVPAIPLPQGAVQSELKEINRLLDVGKDEHATVEPFANRLYDIINNPSLNGGTNDVAEYDLLEYLRLQLRDYISPYLWIEGEMPAGQNFGSIIASSDVSGGAYLWLDSSNDPPASAAGAAQPAYYAQYNFRVNAPGDYDVWLSMAPSTSLGAGPDVSNMTLTFDAGVPLKPDQADTRSSTPYGSLAQSGSGLAGQFAWRRLSSAHLTAGDHTLQIDLHAASAVTRRWILGLDAICLSRGDFHPDGPNQPQP